MKKLYLMECDDESLLTITFYNKIDYSCDYVIAAGNGYFDNEKYYKEYLEKDEVTIITNDVLSLLWCASFWDEKEGHMIYLERANNNNFIKINELTSRELRYGHDLFKMYLNGEFNKEVEE